jgi:hypothetical protein
VRDTHHIGEIVETRWGGRGITSCGIDLKRVQGYASLADWRTLQGPPVTLSNKWPDVSCPACKRKRVVPDTAPLVLPDNPRKALKHFKVKR